VSGAVYVACPGPVHGGRCLACGAAVPTTVDAHMRPYVGLGDATIVTGIYMDAGAEIARLTAEVERLRCEVSDARAAALEEAAEMVGHAGPHVEGICDGCDAATALRERAATERAK